MSAGQPCCFYFLFTRCWSFMGSLDWEQLLPMYSLPDTDNAPCAPESNHNPQYLFGCVRKSQFSCFVNPTASLTSLFRSNPTLGRRLEKEARVMPKRSLEVDS